jgi:hypothetical protein
MEKSTNNMVVNFEFAIDSLIHDASSSKFATFIASEISEPRALNFESEVAELVEKTMTTHT